VTNARRTLLAITLLVGGLTGLSCTPSPVLPPPTSISSGPRLNPSIGNLGRRPQPAGISASIPTPGPVLWKPSTKPREWQYIVVHHTATESGSVESIHESHLKNKDKNGNPWLGIGYHFVIGNGQGMPDGAIEPTFRWKTQIQGAHAGSTNKDYNERGIGVCLVGNFEKTPPTAAQRKSVKLLVQSLKSDYAIPTVNVVGHKDIRASSTECPGKLFRMADIASDEPEHLFGFDPDHAPRGRVATSAENDIQ
jgi:N-acetylmuramoyl-L-alanine amidase